MKQRSLRANRQNASHKFQDGDIDVLGILAHDLPPDLAASVVDHHSEISRARQKGDFEKVLLRGGKLAEAVLKIIHYKRTGALVASISVDEEVKLAESAGDLLPELRTMIPRQARVLYDHRNKRGGGHDSFEPVEMDAAVVSAVANWLLSELLRIFGKQSHVKAHAVAQRLTRRNLPVVEEIGDDLVVLLADASIPEELGLLLLRLYPARTSRNRLRALTLGRSGQSVGTALGRLKHAKRIHETAEGIILTQVGIEWAESLLTRRTDC